MFTPTDCEHFMLLFTWSLIKCRCFWTKCRQFTTSHCRVSGNTIITETDISRITLHWNWWRRATGNQSVSLTVIALVNILAALLWKTEKKKIIDKSGMLRPYSFLIYIKSFCFVSKYWAFLFIFLSFLNSQVMSRCF